MIRQFELSAYRGAPNVPKVLYIPRHLGYATERTECKPECADLLRVSGSANEG